MVRLRETCLLSAKFGQNPPGASRLALQASACYITNLSHRSDPVPSWHWSFWIEQRREILKGEFCDFIFTERNKFFYMDSRVKGELMEAEGGVSSSRGGEGGTRKEGRVEPGTCRFHLSGFLFLIILNWETRARCS